MAKKILVRADDLGFCEAINYGIEKAVKEGIIRSVGVMPNMEAVEHGLALLQGCDVCLGQHTNICAGRPVMDPARIPSLCRPDGSFKTSREYREAFQRGEDFVVLEEVVLEIEAQYHRFVELVGHKPGYFEAHAVMSKNLFRGLEIVSQRYGLDHLPMVFDGPIPFRHTRLYISMESMSPNYDPFASLQKAALRDYGPDGCLMFICHPGYLDDYILKNSTLTIARTQEVAMLTAPETKQWLKEQEITVVSYDELP